MKILLVDQDPELLEPISRAFLRGGYDVVSALDGERALDLIPTARPDMVVLELDLPGIDGFEVCRRVRIDNQVPLIVLTTRDDEEDVMRAFRLGVDDFVVKPYSPRLLVARAAAVLRRTGRPARQQRGDHVQAGTLDLDVQSFEVRKDGQQIRLTPLEFRILHILAANKGRVVPYDRLIEYAWGHDGGSPSHLKIRICSIRKKLGLPVSGDVGIKAIVGTGYTLRGL
ncbi:MAG: response regulator transcription factor [Chloroflexi bacterium]|nr:response regulator transcription factor [Chloroflexota bacterium]